jgi:DNA-binding NtrC family response regulator
MKKFLFIDWDEDVRHYLSHSEDLLQDKELNVRIAASAQEAEEILDREVFDGIIIDAVTPGANKILPFIKRVRRQREALPITALVGFVDMILDDQLKQSLRSERVTIKDKIQALRPENIPLLFKLDEQEK